MLKTVGSLLCVVLPIVVGFSNVLFAGQPCCDLKANHKPEVRFLFKIPIPSYPASCKWTNYWPSALSFAGPARLVVAGHYDCFDPPSLPLSVHVSHSLSYVLLLDAKTGETLKTVEWKDESLSPYRGETIQILPSPAGILVGAGQYLRLLDANLNVVKTRSLPISDRLEQWKAFLSPDGTTGLLRHWGVLDDGSPFDEDHWFAPESLEDSLVESGMAYGSMFLAIDDDAIYYTPRLNRTPEEKRASDAPVYVRRKGEKIGRQLCAECLGVAEKVLGNGAVFISQRGPRAAFSVVRPTGELIFQGRYGNPHDYIHGVVEGNNRAVLNFDHFIVPFRSSVEGAAVISILDETTIFELRVKPSRRQDEARGARPIFPLCTISQDGTVLAALEGTAIYIFRLTSGRP